jgi:hypothetical protein
VNCNNIAFAAQGVDIFRAFLLVAVRTEILGIDPYEAAKETEEFLFPLVDQSAILMDIHTFLSSGVFFLIIAYPIMKKQYISPK